jgi:dimethylamine---corrinoid protein Co-methyltransferase
MASTHALASGMGGMRTAGDLVARMQMTRGMRLPQAKQYVADRLGCSVSDLSDTIAMHDLRRDLGLGRMQVQDLTYPDHAGNIEAKFHIAKVLGIPINAVECFKRNAGLTANVV